MRSGLVRAPSAYQNVIARVRNPATYSAAFERLLTRLARRDCQRLLYKLLQYTDETEELGKPQR